MTPTLGADMALQEALVEQVGELPRGHVLEDLPAAVYTTDKHGRIKVYNRAAVELWGRQPSVDDRWCGSWRLYYPDGRPMPHSECPMAQAIESGRQIRAAEAVSERPDGKLVTFLAYPTPLRDDSGMIVGAVNMLLDITDRKKTENALRQREAELTDLVENTSIGLHWVGPDGTILWANRAEMDLLGVTPDEIIGHHVAEFHADGYVIEDILRRQARFETLKDYEARLRCKDGSIKHVLIDSSVYREGDRVAHTRCFMRDITAQKLVERRLVISAAISQILSQANSVDEAASGVLETLHDHFDADLTELWLGEEELRPVEFYSRLADDALADARAAIEQVPLGPGGNLLERVRQSQKPLLVEQVNPGRQHERRQAATEVSGWTGIGIPILFGKRCLGVITCHIHRSLASDPPLLTMMASVGHKIGQFIERTRGDEASRHLAAVVNASTDAIVSASVNGVITSWNGGAERLYGYSAKQALGQPLSLIVPEDRMLELRKCIARLSRNELVEPFETFRLNAEGDRIPVSISISRITGSNGEFIGSAAIGRDMSGPKAAKAQLTARMRQLQAVSELGMLALTGEGLQILFDQAVERLTEGLDVEFVKLLELQPDGRSLRLRAGAGWREGLVGQATVPADLDSQAGYALSVDYPVVVENLRTETRFHGPSLLLEHNVVSGLSVVIRGEGQVPFGVLGAHTAVSRIFTSHDVHFLQAVANTLATAIEFKTYEDRQEMLIRELSHRVKNSLSVVQAMARQTSIDVASVDDFIRSFEGRLFALAKAHDILTASNWAGASLKKLVELVLGSHAERNRLQLDIEDIKLGSTSTQAMAMVFHELLTNAAKYGALSNDKGRVVIKGRREKDGDESVYALSWREAGGPPVKKPSQYGFGSKLITAAIQVQCSGRLDVDWHRKGLLVDCRLPLAAIAEGTQRPIS